MGHAPNTRKLAGGGIPKRHQPQDPTHTGSRPGQHKN